jgi:hypothetical protein
MDASFVAAPPIEDIAQAVTIYCMGWTIIQDGKLCKLISNLDTLDE